MTHCPARLWLTSLVLLTLVACGGREDMAPVVELNWRATHSASARYVVRRGDTLYAIAFRYDRDYRELAALNHLPPPYTLRVGQVIYIQSVKQVTGTRYPRRVPPSYVRQQRIVPSRSVSKPVASWPVFQSSGGWLWPARGRIVANFVLGQGKKGLDIAGKRGDKIYAAKSGVVAYSGKGLAGYGNLIIIKHDSQFLTAYGHNERNLVQEGQSIKAGQVIAEMGTLDRHSWGVHFEIRKSGKPVNPLGYLK